MNLTEQEFQEFEQANESNWNTLIDTMKRKRGDQYPPDWASRILFNPSFKNKKND